MRPTILMDPELLITEVGGERTQLAEFWERLVTWVDDPRVKVGQHTHALVYNYYAKYGYPESTLNVQPVAMRGPYMRALNLLLSRVSESTASQPTPTFRPDYTGTPDKRQALARDVAGDHGSLVLGIATVASMWTGPQHRVQCLPPPPLRLDLCYTACQELAGEITAAAARHYADMRLHVVGGQDNPRVISSLSADFGFSRGIRWLPSERDSPPRNLDQRWSGLDGEVDITVCIIGSIGHASSNKAARLARSRSVVHLQVQAEKDIAHALIEHYQDNN